MAQQVDKITAKQMNVLLNEVHSEAYMFERFTSKAENKDLKTACSNIFNIYNECEQGIIQRLHEIDEKPQLENNIISKAQHLFDVVKTTTINSDYEIQEELISNLQMVINHLETFMNENELKDKKWKKIIKGFISDNKSHLAHINNININ